jgi:hypothetical protein
MCPQPAVNAALTADAGNRAAGVARSSLVSDMEKHFSEPEPNVIESSSGFHCGY